jgi:O-antigen ligase
MAQISFYITLLLVILNQLTSVFKNFGLSIYLFDIAVLVFTIFWLVYFLLVKKSFKLPKKSYLFIIFSLIAGTSLLIVSPNFKPDELLISGFYLFRFIIYLFSGIVVFNIIENKMMSKEKVFQAFVVSGVLLAFLGFIQLLILPDFTVLDPDLGWDPHKNRLASTFFDPNFVGAYFVLCLTLLFDKFYSVNKKNSKLETKDAVFFLVLLIALVLTFSRSAWGMFGVVVLVYGLFKSRILLISAFFVAFLAYFAIPRVQTRLSGVTDPADSASLRLDSWRNTVKIIKDNFWVGTGFNTYRYVQRDYGFLTPDSEDIHSGAGSDSSLLFVFATTGIFGFLVYLLGVLFVSFGDFAQKNKNWLLSLALVMGFILESQFINSLFYPQIMFLMFSIFFIAPYNT